MHRPGERKNRTKNAVDLHSSEISAKNRLDISANGRNVERDTDYFDVYFPIFSWRTPVHFQQGEWSVVDSWRPVMYTWFSLLNKFELLIIFRLKKNTMASNGDHIKVMKPKPIISRTWSDSYEDVEVPGTPKTPRTSTTPGIFLLHFSRTGPNFIAQLVFYRANL